MSERRELVAIARSLYSRGYAFGAAGNISARVGERVVVSPTNCSSGDLSQDTLAEVTLEGAFLAGPQPSKETPFHLAAYRARPDACAVVHLHSCHATALSCLDDLMELSALEVGRNIEPGVPLCFPFNALSAPLVLKNGNLGSAGFYGAAIDAIKKLGAA